MAVAKSYQGLEITCEPYEKNGRTYVEVKTAKGSIKEVRWYSDKEYAKMYPDAAPVDHSNDPYWKPQRVVLGFEDYYITIFVGDNTYDHKEWFKSIGATYTRFWGWSIKSSIPVPVDLPEGIRPIRLDWSLVGKDDEVLKSEKEVLAALETLIYEPGTSEFQGEIGDKLEVELTVTKNIELEGYYGTSHMHEFEDDLGNVYVWITSAKNWEVGSIHVVKGTIKELKTYKNVKQTVLTRCREAA